MNILCILGIVINSIALIWLNSRLTKIEKAIDIDITPTTEEKDPDLHEKGRVKSVSYRHVNDPLFGKALIRNNDDVDIDFDVESSTFYHNDEHEITDNEKIDFEKTKHYESANKKSTPLVLHPQTTHQTTANIVVEKKISVMPLSSPKREKKYTTRRSKSNREETHKMPNKNNTPRSLLQQKTSSSSLSTKCFLMSYGNETFTQKIKHDDIPDTSTNFDLNFQIETDEYPEETSWYLTQRNEDKLTIDSNAQNETSLDLLPFTLYNFKYTCYVIQYAVDLFSILEHDKSKICYDFEIRDTYGDGICCWNGLGRYSLTLNENSKEPLASGRFYAYSAKTPFCLGGKDYIGVNEDDYELLYPSKECITDNNKCSCDSNPNLLSNFDDIDSKYDGLYELKSRALTSFRFLSGQEKLLDETSPQYKAACWVLNDDPYLTQYYAESENGAGSSSSSPSPANATIAEKRMTQRYILAVHYFATKPHNWKKDVNFLSSKSECDWYDEEVNIGIRCNENDDIIYFLFEDNNLDGSIMGEEISGLRSLEFLEFYREHSLRGSIPSSLGKLSKLKALILEENTSLEGTIPPAIFDATKVERLYIRKTSISGEIPESISKAQSLQWLDLSSNQLHGPLPNELYSLSQLGGLLLNDNLFTSSLSHEVKNLQKLQIFTISNNQISGTIPESVGNLTDLEHLDMSNNNLSGPIPSSLNSLTNIANLHLFQNELEGDVLDEICKVEPTPIISADCRNDVFTPKTLCSCCSYCYDKTPIPECADTSITVVIEHYIDTENDVFGVGNLNSQGLEWSLVQSATNKTILRDGPYEMGQVQTSHEQKYVTCAASSDCFSFHMMRHQMSSSTSSLSDPTNYAIYWNEKLVVQDTFVSPYNQTVFPVDLLFHYDASKDEIDIGSSSCSEKEEKEIVCGDSDESPIVMNTQQRIMYNAAIKISGTSKVEDNTSSQARALCWIIGDIDSPLFKDIENDAIEAIFTQRYILTLLHVMSVDGLFGNEEYPPATHECQWEGVGCGEGRNIVKYLTLKSSSEERNQKIIRGNLTDEIGSLSFLEVLEMSGSELIGTIPSSFSNLYSLRKLDLSSNKLTGPIPESFFHQLERLESIDISDNDMSGDIPSGLGKYSPIKDIRLNKNKFTGLLKFDEFTKYDLEHIDVSRNQFSGHLSESLIHQTSLVYLNLARNFFTGDLSENIFDSLTKLQYFDVSNNEFTGNIPSNMHHHTSKIIYFDAHSNRFNGNFPTSITKMKSLEHLNLQGNEISGSIPFEFNSLESLNTLVLSYNNLKGSIPFQLENLSNLTRLYLHGNQLSGEAPPDSAGILETYITDCGFPSISVEDPVVCKDCNICCNAADMCQIQNRSELQPTGFAVILIFSLVVVMVFIYSMRKVIVHSRFLIHFFENVVDTWKAIDLIGEGSVYQFFLVPNKLGWVVGFFCAVGQIALTFLFVIAADIGHDGTDLQYTITCSKNSLECEDSVSRTSIGYLIFTLVLGAWLLRDIIGASKLFLLSMWKGNIDFFFAGSIVFLVSFFSASTSVYYNLATAITNTDIIKDAVILLFVNELDERFYEIAEGCNKYYVSDVNEALEHSTTYHDDHRLVIEKSFHKVHKRVSDLLSRSSSKDHESISNDYDDEHSHHNQL